MEVVVLTQGLLQSDTEMKEMYDCALRGIKFRTVTATEPSAAGGL